MFIFGMLTSFLILFFGSLIEFIRIRLFFKKFNYRLSLFTFFFHYYLTICDYINIKYILIYEREKTIKNKWKY